MSINISNFKPVKKSKLTTDIDYLHRRIIFMIHTYFTIKFCTLLQLNMVKTNSQGPLKNVRYNRETL